MTSPVLQQLVRCQCNKLLIFWPCKFPTLHICMYDTKIIFLFNENSILPFKPLSNYTTLESIFFYLFLILYLLSRQRSLLIKVSFLIFSRSWIFFFDFFSNHNIGVGFTSTLKSTLKVHRIQFPASLGWESSPIGHTERTDWQAADRLAAQMDTGNCVALDTQMINDGH